jgi:Spy/CpxP family protein refolding chaperone
MAPLFRAATLFLSTLLIGCARSDAPPTPDASARAPAEVAVPAARAAVAYDASTNAADAAAPRPVVGGIVGTILDATSAQALSAVQIGTFDEVARMLTADRRELREAEEGLRAEVLLAVKGGADAGAAQARYAVIEQGARARADDEARALVRIHDALEPAQRAAVAAEARAKVTTRRDNRKSLDAQTKTPSSVDPRLKERSARLERELALDASQKKAMDGLFASYAGTPTAEAQFARQLNVLAAFDATDFDERKARDVSGAGTPRLPSLVEDAKFYLGLAAVLRPTQREKLAAIMQLGDRPILRPAVPGVGHDREHEHGHGP